MKVTVLSDNLTEDRSMQTEHGLSLFIETGDQRILFDTGQGDVFLHNAQKLEIDLSTVNYVVLSHGHYDHSGGIKTFLEINSTAKIILKPQALLEKYKPGKYLGIPKDLKLPDDRLVFVNNEFALSQDIDLIGNIEVFHPGDTHFGAFYIQDHNKRIPDLFEDELFMIIKLQHGIVLITGCSHHGIRNIIATARKRRKVNILGVIGGFHLKDSGTSVVDETGTFLKEQHIGKIVTCHCTGYDNYEQLKAMDIPEITYGFAGTSHIFKNIT